MAKKKAAKAAAALDRLKAICESLPGTTHEAWYDHHTFKVGKKTFAYYLNNHHGDGKYAVACKSTKPRQAELVRSDPERFYLPAYMAHQGWIGLRVDVLPIDWDLVATVMIEGFRLQAAKKLLAMLDEETG
jgi:predicted DNA-binding protein (MmcQ/YjbR family)